MTEARQSLQKLAETIHAMVADAKAKKTVEPEEEPFWQWRVKDFKYTDRGLTQSGAEGSYITQKTWLRAESVLGERVREHAAFTSALDDLERNYPAESGIQRHLDTLAAIILRICLYNDQDEDIQREADSKIERFLEDLAGGLVTYKAKVEIVGVGLQPTNTSLDAGISIRQPTKEDLEKTVRVVGFFHDPFARPSAILDIELRSTPGNASVLQGKVEQCVALLRLFNVGSVNWTSYDMWSDSLLDLMGHGTLRSGARAVALETYVVKSEEEPKLKQFWRTLNVLLPKDIYDFQKQISHITLAYDRYSDGLLQNGIVERRIASAVMGLEALYLEEAQELSYRLGLRTSKILSVVGRNALEVREVIKDAYAIRSVFAHGKHLGKL